MTIAPHLPLPLLISTPFRQPKDDRFCASYGGQGETDCVEFAEPGDPDPDGIRQM